MSLSITLGGSELWQRREEDQNHVSEKDIIDSSVMRQIDCISTYTLLMVIPSSLAAMEAKNS